MAKKFAGESAIKKVMDLFMKLFPSVEMTEGEVNDMYYPKYKVAGFGVGIPGYVDTITINGITINGMSENVTVKEGDKVTVVLGSIGDTIKDFPIYNVKTTSTQQEIIANTKITNTTKETFSFIMPDSDVTIYVMKDEPTWSK